MPYPYMFIVPKPLIKVKSEPKPDLISFTCVRRIQVICVLSMLIPTKDIIYLPTHILVLFMYLIVGEVNDGSKYSKILYV